jgi:N utilization substance protein B
MSKRRYARECVMQALYAHELAGGDPAHTIDTVIRPRLHDDDPILEFAVDLFRRSVELREVAIAIIQEHTRNWELDRIAIIDRILLQMAIVEFLELKDVPPKVTMNELIEIAKKYSTSRSGRFINGILDAVLERLTAEGRIVKTGRGLIGMESNHNASS